MFTGSFRLATGTRHLHRDFNFTEPLVETASKSLRHSCRSELTRQGISLEQHLLLAADSSTAALTEPCSAGRAFLPTSARRHADRTISSPALAGALACGL